MMTSKSILSLIALSLLSASQSAAIEIEIKTPVGADRLHTIERHHEFIQYLDTVRNSENKHHIQIPPALIHLRNDFVEWMTKFSKVYESMEEEFERMLIWVQNHEFIERHNSQTPKPSYTVGHNRFSDMTNDEFQKMHSLGKYSPGADVIKAAHQKNIREFAMRKVDKFVEEQRNQVKAEYRYLRKLAEKLDEDVLFFDDGWFDDDKTKPDDKTDDKTDDNDTDGLPDEIDWVKNGAVTPVKNQGACGSCWAFSTTGSIEGASFIKTGELVSLSEQNLIDCDTTDHGCSGGMMETAFKFDEAAKGLCSEIEYPYLAIDSHTCASNCTKVAGSLVADYHDIPPKDKHGLIASIALQPTSIAMEAGQLGFQLYSSGVFSDKDCGATGAVDHGVLAVGYGTDAASGKKYFTVKNSWGADWGEKGYFRLDRKSDNEWGTCAILLIMTTPIMA